MIHVVFGKLHRLEEPVLCYVLVMYIVQFNVHVSVAYFLNMSSFGGKISLIRSLLFAYSLTIFKFSEQCFVDFGSALVNGSEFPNPEGIKFDKKNVYTDPYTNFQACFMFVPPQNN
jgi:hypothetical protein